ncbi:Ig-like domain-containing protein, partial [Cribrihabitans sp. XS_ASV171]
MIYFRPVPADFIVNQTLEGDQRRADVAVLGGDRFIAVWQDESEAGLDTDGSGILGRFFDLSGTPLGDEFVINATLEGDQWGPRVISGPDGKFFVSWRDGDLPSHPRDTNAASQLKGQTFEADGTPVGEIVTISSDTILREMSLEWGDAGLTAYWRSEGSLKYTQFSPESPPENVPDAIDLTGEPGGTPLKVLTLANGRQVAFWNIEIGIADFLDGQEPVRRYLPEPISDVIALPDGGFAAVWLEPNGRYSKQVIFGSFDDDGTLLHQQGFSEPFSSLRDSDISSTENFAPKLGVDAEGNIAVLAGSFFQVFDEDLEPISAVMTPFGPFHDINGTPLPPEDTFRMIVSGNDIIFVSDSENANDADVNLTIFDMTQEATPPAAPVITGFITSDGDGIIDFHDRTQPYTIIGTGEPGTYVTGSASWSEASATRVSAGGSWSYTARETVETWSPLDGTLLWVRDKYGVVSDTVLAKPPADSEPPFIELDQPVGGDHVLTDAELAEGVEIAGKTEVAATIEVTFGDHQWSTMADIRTGRWSILLEADDFDGYEQGNLDIRATDWLGNEATLDGLSAIWVVAGLSQLDPFLTSPVLQNAVTTEAGLTFEGRTELAEVVTLGFNGETYALATFDDGRWRITLPEGDIPVDGDYDLTLKARDADGNEGATVLQKIILDRQAPAAPELRIEDPDGIFTYEDLEDGINISGVSEQKT